MVAILTLLATLIVATLVTRIGAVALKLTGLSEDVARFQARSAFTGVGFTTAEAEKVVNHPVRRRIVGLLMVCGNIGIAAVVAGMMATIASGDVLAHIWLRLGFVFAILAILWVVFTRPWVDQTISRIIEWALLRWANFDSADYVSLLRLASGYVVLELEVKEGNWVAGKTLADTRLASEGILVLGIRRADGTYYGSPNGSTVLRVGDLMTVYGLIERLEELNLRKEGWRGDALHKRAIAAQREKERQSETEEHVSELGSGASELPDDDL